MIYKKTNLKEKKIEDSITEKKYLDFVIVVGKDLAYYIQ